MTRSSFGVVRHAAARPRQCQPALSLFGGQKGGEKRWRRGAGGLDLEKAGDTLCIVGCCTQAVNSIGGHCHKHAGLQSTDGFMYQVPTRWVW